MLRRTLLALALLAGCGPAFAYNETNVSPLQIGPLTTNPFGVPFPSWMYGVGSLPSGYYDIQPLANSSLYAPNGPGAFSNAHPYGSLGQPGGFTATAGSNRPGCILGVSNPNQVSSYNETGLYASCEQTDSAPQMLTSPGAYTSTTFTPTTPITITSDTFAAVGMWIRSSDPNPWQGQVTSWTTSSGKITSFTVSGWYKKGGGATPGTPSGALAFINPMDKGWVDLNVDVANVFPITATATSGSNVLTGVSDVTHIVPQGQFIADAAQAYVPNGTFITDVNFATSTVTLSQNATSSSSGATSFNVTAGSAMGHSQNAEFDLINMGWPYLDVTPSGTADGVTGNLFLTNVSDITEWRPKMVFIGSPRVSAAAYVTAVDVPGNKLYISEPLLTTFTGGAILGRTHPNDGVNGLDCNASRKTGQSCFADRGSVYFPFYSHAAVDTSFFVRPDGSGEFPKYGFRFDHFFFPGLSTTADFAVTNGSTVKWAVNSDGSQTGPNITLNGLDPITITNTAGTYRSIWYKTSGSNRWLVGVNNTAEGGSNAGTDFSFLRYDDTGVLIDAPMQIIRSSGQVRMSDTMRLTPMTFAQLTGTGAYLCPAKVPSGSVAYLADTVASGAPVWHGNIGTGGGATVVSSLITCTGANWQYE